MNRRIQAHAIQKFLISWAVVALTLGNAAPAFAAQGDGKGTSTTGSITIDQSISHPAAAYQVFDGDVESDGSIANVQWGSGVNGAALATELSSTPGFENCSSARDFAQKLSVIHYNSSTQKWEPVTNASSTESGSESRDTALAKTFAEIVSKHLNSAGSKAFDDTTSPNVGGLDDGWYVVASNYGSNPTTGASLLFPGLITVGAGNSTVTPKESTPTLIKQVRESSSADWADWADVEIGQTFQQQLVATIGDADFRYYNSYSLSFSDVASASIDIDKSTVKVFIDNEDCTNYFTTTYSGHTLTVASNGSIKDKLAAGKQVIVSYNATLNSSATTGSAANTNTATLTYTADPRYGGKVTNAEIKATTTGDATNTYTYQLTVKKSDAADATNMLAGAKFGIQNSEGKWAVLAASNGTRDVATNNNTGNTTVYVTGWAETSSEAGYATTNENGQLTIIGLDSDAYKLVEIVAPNGYDLDETPVNFTISAGTNSSSELNTLSIATDKGTANGTLASGSVSMSVSDVKSPVLPTTGLGGIVTSVVLGGGLVAGAALVITRQLSAKKVGR